MPRKVKKKVEKAESAASISAPVHWLRANYHFHVFHYRMPGTVAIASVTPFVPSPLTVKMALVASLLQSGDDKSAKQLAPLLPQIEVRIVPPSSAFSFKAFLRYRSVPAPPEKDKKTGKLKLPGLDESGSYYPSRPHTREYALMESGIILFVGLPDKSISEIVKTALQGIRYLGCKDSLVTCLGVEEANEDEVKEAKTVQLLQEDVSGSVILGADFKNSARIELMDLIPGGSIRKEDHYYTHQPFILPGKIFVRGRTRVFKAELL